MVVLSGALLGLNRDENPERYADSPLPQTASAVTLIEKVEKKKEPVFKEPSHISLRDLPPKERKKEFVKLMLPLIERANREVLKERALLLKVREEASLSAEEREKLERLMRKYRTTDINELLKRVNTVPPGLVLAQAAIESGWGTSRFFTEANNAFGIYSFRGGKCIKAKGSSACLKVYSSLYESVRDYIYNLNVGWAYKRFRELRSRGADIYTLIESLYGYSEMKDEYTELVKKVVRKNRFDSIGEPLLASNSSGIN